MYDSIRMAVSVGEKDIMIMTKTTFIPQCPDDLRGKKIHFSNFKEFTYLMRLAEDLRYRWASGDRPTDIDMYDEEKSMYQIR